ncbi:DEAD/DEAH box helicase [Neisseria sp. N95_16]|nr:DEAD/DEAH box helicase [Neisseria sp. N95_16]
MNTTTLSTTMLTRLNEYNATAPKIHFSPRQQHYPFELYLELKSAGMQFEHLPLFYSDATEEVYRKYKLPYPLYPYQKAWVDAFATNEAAAMYFQVGAGKTATATVAALHQLMHHQGHVIILMPPILLDQWEAWLKKIEGIQSVCLYRGSPTEREKLDLDAQFVLMSMDIFKRDFKRIYTFYATRNATLIVDEAVCVKNPSTQNHKCVWAFHNLNTSKISTQSQRPSTATRLQQTRPKVDTSAVDKLKAMLKEKYR